MMLNQLKLLIRFKPKHVFFAVKLAILKMRYGRSLSLSTYTLALEQDALLKITGNASAKFGDMVYVSRNSTLDVRGDACLEIGSEVFINKNCTIVSRFGVTVGNDCLIGENVSIYDHDHEFSMLGRPIKEQGYRGKRIVIGDRVWIGASAFIGKGVTIGDDVVIGAHAIITKDVQKNSVVYCDTTLKTRPR